MQNYLITIDEVASLARSMSTHLDKNEVETYLKESENIDLRMNLGDALFLDLKEHPENYTLLLNGGIYEDGKGRRLLTGLKSALAYYTFARVVKNKDGQVTRFGFMNKEGEYSSRVDLKEKVMAYNDAFSVADTYMKEVVSYLNLNKKKFPLYKGNGGIKANRTTFRILGE